MITPAQILINMNGLQVMQEPTSDTMIMPIETYQYLYYRDRPMLKILHDAGRKVGFTVNGFEP